MRCDQMVIRDGGYLKQKRHHCPNEGVVQRDGKWWCRACEWQRNADAAPARKRHHERRQREWEQHLDAIRATYSP